MSINRKNADGTYTEVAGIPFVTKENIGLGKVENKSPEELVAMSMDAAGYVTPQMYGAVADGVTDDTEAVKRALSTRKPLYVPAGTYNITETINVTEPVKIIGDGSELSIFTGNLSGFVFEFGKTPKKWYTSSYFLSRFAIKNTGAGGSAMFKNATQSRVSDCVFSVPNRTDQYNVFISDETHWFIFDNNYVIGGKGIIIDTTSNGITITNNYICYCKSAITANGGNHVIKHNDVEGYNEISYILNCKNSEIECLGERNVSGTWIRLTGEYNKLDVSMYSDGGKFYNPLFDITGKNNKIFLHESLGYKLFDDDATNGEYNTFEIIDPIVVMNTRIMKAPSAYEKNKFEYGFQELLLSEFDDITKYIENDPSEYSYNPETREFILRGKHLVFNFESLVPNNVYGYLFFSATGISAPTHNKFQIKNGGEDSETSRYFYVNDLLVGLSGYADGGYTRKVRSEVGLNGQSFRIDKLRISNHLTNKLFEDIKLQTNE